MDNKHQVIIIKKKKGGQHGHHGGAWKVAYADFVTAMMALFIVLWLMNTSKAVQEAVGGYFRDPYGSARKVGHDIGAGEPLSPKDDLEKVKNQILRAMQAMPGFEKLKSQIEITVTSEGLRIELLEKPSGTFFENGKAEPTEALQEVLKVLSVQAGRLPNPISIEGHTDSVPFSDSRTYGNWELSTDRANAARRLMEQSGLRQGQVTQVRGYADRKLRKPENPQDASNRRISVLIQYLPVSQDPPPIVTSGALPTALPESVAASSPPKPAAASPSTAKPTAAKH